MKSDAARDGDGAMAETCERLLAQLRSELVPLLESRRNFKIEVNVPAGHKWKINVHYSLDSQ